MDGTRRAMPIQRRVVCVIESRTVRAIERLGRRVVRLVQRDRIAAARLEVDELREQLDAADAVGDRVVHLHHDRGATVVEALDHGRFPQRTRPVEAHAGDRADEVEEPALVARRRHHDAAEVEVEIEVRILRQRGGPIRIGGVSTRWRRRGIVRLACS